MSNKIKAIVPAVALLTSIATIAVDPAAAATPADKQSAAPAANHRNDSKPIQNLELAAQRLRDAIHAMAQAPAGKARTDAIKQANRALYETQTAMTNLPPELLTAGARETDYQQAMDRLQQAAQRLRDAAHALATEPAGERRNETMKKINQALLETQQTMIDVPMHVAAKSK